MSIIQETRTLNGGTFIVTYSNAGMMIENEDGIRYSEAWDLPTVQHTYHETDEPIDGDEEYTEDDEYAAAGRIMLGLGE